MVRIAIGSLGETINHLGHAGKQNYLSEEEARDLVTLAKRAKGASNAWLAYLESCPPDGPRRRTEARENRSNESARKGVQEGGSSDNGSPDGNAKIRGHPQAWTRPEL
jgi:hypothetical protein